MIVIYLDNNATTAIDPRVVRAMDEIWGLGPLNPSSQHAAGRRARACLDDACQRIARALGADILTTGADRLLLTSGGTEANNWALRYLLPLDRVRLVSPVEHPSILETARHLRSSGTPVQWLRVDQHGVLDLDDLRENLRASQAPGLVSVMLANNETGVLQPMADISQLCREFDFIVHSDATQYVGKLPLNFHELGVDAISFAAHKFHGPVGVGGLLLAGSRNIEPWLRGGGQQLAARPGTEPVALVVGMAQALEIACEEMDIHIRHMTTLRDCLETRLLQAVPDSVVHGQQVSRLPSTTSISFPGIDRQTLLIRLDRAGVACGTGSACASGSSEPSHVLIAMGLPAEWVESALRYGVSRFSTSAEVEDACDRIIQCCNKLRSGGYVEK